MNINGGTDHSRTTYGLIQEWIIFIVQRIYEEKGYDPAEIRDKLIYKNDVGHRSMTIQSPDAFLNGLKNLTPKGVTEEGQ